MRTTGASVARGGIWNVAARGMPQLFLVFVSIAAARFLGPKDFGRQSFIAFAEVSAIVLVTAGLPTAMIRYVGDAVGRGNPAAARGLLRWAWRIELVPSLAAGVILAAVGFAGGEPRLAWVLAGAGAAAGALFRVPMSFLNGLQRWREVSIVGLITSGAGAAATILVLALGGRITGMFAVDAAASLVMLLALARIVGKRSLELASETRVDPFLRRAALRFAALASVGIVLSFVIWRRSEFFILARYSTDSQLGFYSIAFVAAAAPVVLFQGLTGVIAPAISTLLGAGASDRVKAGFARAVRLLFLLALPMTSAALALGPAVIRLAYGDEFEHAVRPLLIMLIVTPVVPVINLGAALLIGSGRLGVTIAAGLLAAGVDISLAFLLVPDYGANGAAIANDAAQVTIGIPVVVYAWRTVGGVDWRPTTLVRISCCSMLGGAVAWGCVRLLGDGFGLPTGLILGAVAFGGAASLLRVLAYDDARWLDDTIGPLLGGRLGLLFRRWAARPPEAKPL